MVLPPRPSFQHAFTRRALRARPVHLAGYSPELTGHVKPIDFCSCQESRAQPRAPQTSSIPWRASSPGEEERCPKEQPQPNFTAQGSFLPRREHQPPHRRPHADADLPQPDPSGHLVSRIDNPSRLDKAALIDRADRSKRVVSDVVDRSRPPRFRVPLDHKGRASDGSTCLSSTVPYSTALPLGPPSQHRLAKAMMVDRARGAFHSEPSSCPPTRCASRGSGLPAP